ncbi:hypothetical protein F4780DRAFT_564404 [Xylariomycetidae sp. FL0641]|nr:hypothetical protein F4780DRAFT_564404 [Xylariomycetidae sp. FL0641]
MSTTPVHPQCPHSRHLTYHKDFIAACHTALKKARLFRTLQWEPFEAESKFRSDRTVQRATGNNPGSDETMRFYDRRRRFIREIIRTQKATDDLAYYLIRETLRPNVVVHDPKFCALLFAPFMRAAAFGHSRTPPISKDVLDLRSEISGFKRYLRKHYVDNDRDLGKIEEQWRKLRRRLEEQATQNTEQSIAIREVVEALQHGLVTHFGPRFPQFSRLPVEVQTKIWDFSIQAHVIDIRELCAGRSSVPEHNKPHTYVLCSKAPAAPVAAHVCRVSRSLATRSGAYLVLEAVRYKCDDARRMSEKDPAETEVIRVWFDTRKDTVVFHPLCCHHNSHEDPFERNERNLTPIRELLRSIQSISLCGRGHWAEKSGFIHEQLRRVVDPRFFPNLKEVKMVTGTWVQDCNSPPELLHQILEGPDKNPILVDLDSPDWRAYANRMPSHFAQSGSLDPTAYANTMPLLTSTNAQGGSLLAGPYVTEDRLLALAACEWETARGEAHRRLLWSELQGSLFDEWLNIQ